MILNIGGLHQPPPYLKFWQLTLPPGKVVPPTFFRQNERNGCSNNVLGALGHFLSRFKATEKNL